MSAYKGCISRVQLYGPTNFAPTVNHMAGIAREFVDGSQYFILLIITDGIITDMPQTKKVGPHNSSCKRLISAIFNYCCLADFIDTTTHELFFFLSLLACYAMLTLMVCSRILEAKNHFYHVCENI